MVTIFYGIDGDLKSNDSGALLRYMGGNTGNLLFRHALQECVVDLSIAMSSACRLASIFARSMPKLVVACCPVPGDLSGGQPVAAE